MLVPHETPLRRTVELIQQGIREKLHYGVQLYVSRNFETIADFAVGENAPGEDLTSDTLMLWMSSGKPITAVAIMRLIETGTLGLDQRVAEVIPEFGQNGKEAVTFRHLLTHTAGLRPIVTGWPHRSWQEIIEKICQNPLQKDWVPGKRAAYDPARTWFLLGETLQRIHRRPFAEILHEQVFAPVGMMESLFAVPEAKYDTHRNRLGIAYNLKNGELVPTNGHQLQTCTHPSPGGSLRGPARDLGSFYETLLRGGKTRDGASLLSQETVRLMTSRQREGMRDETFQHQIDFGLGLIINSNRYGAETVPYGFGRSASETAFGHGGAQSSIGFADPQHELVVAVVANGFPGEEQHNQRFRDLTSAIYADLGLA